eukprot:IDg23171t1
MRAGVDLRLLSEGTYLLWSAVKGASHVFVHEYGRGRPKALSRFDFSDMSALMADLRLVYTGMRYYSRRRYGTVVVTDVAMHILSVVNRCGIGTRSDNELLVQASLRTCIGGPLVGVIADDTYRLTLWTSLHCCDLFYRLVLRLAKRKLLVLLAFLTSFSASLPRRSMASK